MADGVSELVARILDNLVSSSFQEINWIFGVKDELERMKENLLAIDAVLLDAQEKQSTSKSVRNWLQNLKLVAYDIEDVLDLMSTQDLELKVNGRSLFRKITKLFTNYDVARALKVTRQRLDEVEHIRRKFNLEEQGTIPLLAEATVQRETYSYVRESDIIGREEDQQKIISCLLSSSSQGVECLSVIPIIGIGGMGKTTLAKLLFNDPVVLASFELRLWAHVSDKFVLRTLMASMLQSVAGGNCSHFNMELLHSKLREELGGRTYLLILDDVWINDPKQWMELMDLLATGSPRSRIIMTTREERVAHITGTTEAYKLKGLSDDYCWSIFSKCAFNKGEEEAYPLLVEIGKSMVRKCCGVPLAAKTLGSVLRNERDDHTWKQIEESKLWKIGQGPNDILPALKLSYYQTPHYLKSCFTVCLVVGKVFPMLKVGLIYMWMALGLLQSRGGEDVESIGDTYFNELVLRSFLQVPKVPVANKTKTKYTKLFHETNLWRVSHMSEKNFIEVKDLILPSLSELNIYVVEMHDLVYDLALYVSEEEIAIATSHIQVVSPKARHILWDYEDLSRKEFPMHLFKASKARTFAFTHPMGYVSESFLKGLMSNFKCLRILNLWFSEFKELPDSVGDLKHLRFLNLCLNTKVIVLPQSTCKLVNLQTLVLFGCLKLETLPEEIHKLVSLRYLDLTSKLTRFPIGSLNTLRSLRFLRLLHCPCLSSLSKGIGSLKNLHTMEIIDCAWIASLPNDMKYLTNLEELRIFNCERLDLKGWEGLCGLRSLKYLDFRGLPKLLAFPDGVDSTAGSLQYFKIVSCEGLRALPEGLKHCTSLLRLTLSDCPNMTALPRYMHAFKFLQELNIGGCPELSRRCQKDLGSDWHLISHIPEMYINDQVIYSSKSDLP